MMKIFTLSVGIKGFSLIVILVGFAILFPGCASNKYSSKVAGESVALKVKEDANLIKYATLQPQNTPELASESKSRGMVDIIGKVASTAVNGVKGLIQQRW